MIRALVVAEFAEDAHGPAESYCDFFVIPETFATTAKEAHERIRRLLETEDYIEIPDAGPLRIVPLNTETVRLFAVWADGC